jgi:hypothetical protein
MSASSSLGTRQAGFPLLAKLAVTALSIPLARMELIGGSFPFIHHWFEDYSYGMMFRLGITFGLVILVWHLNSTRDLWNIRKLAFVPASIASALLATWIGNRVGSDYDLLAIVISGAIFLALSEKLLLGAGWLPTVVAMIAAPGLFYLVLIPMGKILADGSTAAKTLGNYWPLIWQTGYVLGMFGVAALMCRESPATQPADH